MKAGYWFLIWYIPPVWLDSTEIEDLWYYNYDSTTREKIIIYPTDTIIHATVCYGYAVDSSSTPYTALAFIEYGAAAFIGATVTVPSVYNDDFTDDFWNSLCQDDESVYTATLDYINAHNTYYPSDLWNYRTEIKICGVVQSVLDN
ncbi:MAG: hypothetical protein ACTSRU_04870 [Candidatus Hodarchaeales archaeon]